MEIGELGMLDATSWKVAGLLPLMPVPPAARVRVQYSSAPASRLRVGAAGREAVGAGR